ncbi:MAG: hypothetical protein H6737_20505 [Alphaproteobacteria bacterium]|nr:hypothetical protein [Alphaproteobacteria bacterium]
MGDPASRIRVDFVLSRVLAIVLPLGLLAFGFDHLVSTQTRDAKRQLENAGQLLNGEVLKIPVTEAIHKRMSLNPELVLIGNSFANTNIQVGQLGHELGMESGATVRLSIPNTIGAHWYALLAHRVFVPDYRAPDVIVIVSDLQSALLTQPLSEGSYRNLLSLLSGPDPVVDAKVEGSRNFVWEQMLENRAKVRRNAVNSVRDAAARRVLAVPRGKVRKQTNEAMDRVFHASRVDPTLRAVAMPVSVGEEDAQIDLSQLPEAGDSFLPDIARLCHEHGARLVMVRNKESPLMPPGQGDIVPPGRVAEVRALLAEWGGVMIDMDPVPMVSAHYDNLDHMTDDGSRRFTSALAEALNDLGIAEDRARYVRPLPPSAIEVPTPSEAPLAGIRRSWRALDAGATATWRWDEAWPGASDTFRVRGVFEGSGEPPVLTVDGRRAPVLALGGRWIAEITAPPPSGPWELSVTASGPVTIEGLEVGTGSTPLYLAGYRPDVRGHRLELLGRLEVFDGELYRDAIAPVFPASTPALPALPALQNGPGPTVFVDTPELEALSDSRTRVFTPLRARCSPVRVRENGIPLPHANVGCKEVRELGKGRMCHTDRKVFFTASDTTHPTRNRRRYGLFLDPERACDGGFWMYPGDTTRLEVPPNRLRELRDGVRALEMRIGIAEAGEGFALNLRIRVNGEIRVSTTLDQAATRGDIAVPIEPPIGPDDTVQIVLENPTDAYLVVSRAALVPPPIVWESF